MAIWVIVADAGRARIFEAESARGSLTEVLDKADPLARIPENELASDEPGRNRGPAGTGSHGMQEKVTPRDTEDARFAKEIVAEIGAAIESHRIDKFFLMAPPHFLGVVRTCMSQHIAKAMAGDLNKDLTTHSVADIQAHLAEMA